MSAFPTHHCPQHGPDCHWYQHNPDQVGLDLGYGDGFANAADFCQAHEPMTQHELPVSNGRGDYFALGFLSGATAAWCREHVGQGCFGNWACHLRVEAEAAAIAHDVSVERAS